MRRYAKPHDVEITESTQCRYCERVYRNLAVHLRHAHGECPKIYKRRFNIRLTTPLACEALRDKLSKVAESRLDSEEWREAVTSMCAENAAANKGSTRGAYRIPEVSSRGIGDHNRLYSERFRKKYLPRILPDYIAGMPKRALCAKHGISHDMVTKWENEGWLPGRTLRYVIDGSEKAQKAG